MSEIKRYFCESTFAGLMFERPLGVWVRYDDHLAAVEATVMAEREACAVAVEAEYKGKTIRCEYEAGFDWGIEKAEQIIRARTTQPAEGSK